MCNLHTDPLLTFSCSDCDLFYSYSNTNYINVSNSLSALPYSYKNIISESDLSQLYKITKPIHLDIKTNNVDNCSDCGFRGSPDAGDGVSVNTCGSIRTNSDHAQNVVIESEALQFSCAFCDQLYFNNIDYEEHLLIHDCNFNPLLGHSYSLGPKQCNISFISLNVCGLSSKLEYPEFKNALENFDVISLCETKLDNADNEYITSEFSNLGFTIFIKNRKNLTTWRSGGLLVAVKTKLSHLVCNIECHNDFMIVLKLDKRFLGFDKDIIYITTYVPPYTSRYSNIDHFAKISNTILDFDPDDFYHLVVGDLNAHTGLESDLVKFDETIFRLLDIDEDTRARLDIIQTMDILGLPIERSSVDHTIDRSNYGKAVLDICKNHLLCIFNGRAGTDRLIGNATTTDGSVIDYVIGSPFLLSKIKHFNINDFDSLFSDKHRSIEWFFSNDNAGANSRNNNYKPPQVSNTNSVYWDPNKATDFIANIDRIAIANMIDNFECLSINQITDNIKHILISSAKVSFPKYRQRPNKPSKFQCYTKEARKLTQEYRKAKLRNNRHKSIETQNDLIAKSKACRKEIIKVRALNKKRTIQKLRDLKDKDPKQYWRILQGNKREKINVSHRRGKGGIMLAFDLKIVATGLICNDRLPQ